MKFKRSKNRNELLNPVYVLFNWPLWNTNKKKTGLKAESLQIERLYVNGKKTGTSWLPLSVVLVYISALQDRVGNTMF